MATSISADWIEELAARAATLEIDASLSFVIEQRITGEPEATWHIDLSEGRVRIGSGPHRAPVLTLTTDRAIAEAIRAGELSAQRAFLDGDLRIGGDIARLLEHRDALDEVARLLGAAT